MSTPLTLTGSLTADARHYLGRLGESLLELRLGASGHGLPIIVRRSAAAGFASAAAATRTAALLRRGTRVTVELADGLALSRSGKELVGRITHVDAEPLREPARTQVDA